MFPTPLLTALALFSCVAFKLYNLTQGETYSDLINALNTASVCFSSGSSVESSWRTPRHVFWSHTASASSGYYFPVYLLLPPPLFRMVPTHILKAFSENGALLASVGQDDNHCLAVHDWEKGKLQHTGPTDMRAVRERYECNHEKYDYRSFTMWYSEAGQGRTPTGQGRQHRQR